MIAFWVDRAGRFGIDDFLARVGGATAGRVQPIVYEDLEAGMVLRARTHVFAGLDRLTDAQVRAVESLWRGLSAHESPVRLLNHPAATLRRFELLEHLSDAGINRFRAFRPQDGLGDARFPVFVRHRVRHTGAMTRLLQNPRAVGRALTALYARGHRPRDLLVVEYCDTSDATGAFRKYAALKIGDRIVPRHMLIDRQWMVKGECNSPTLPLAREEMEYVAENPHESRLLEICGLAAVDYGRLDYAMLDGQPQIWEINLNPTLGGRSPQPERPGEVQRLVDERLALSDRRLSEAFAALDAGPEPTALAFQLDAATRTAVRRELSARRRRQNAIAALHRVYEHPAAGRPFRWAYGRLFARR